MNNWLLVLSINLCMRNLLVVAIKSMLNRNAPSDFTEIMVITRERSVQLNFSRSRLIDLNYETNLMKNCSDPKCEFERVNHLISGYKEDIKNVI